MSGKVIRNPEIVNRLFETTSFAWLWLIIRLFVGWKWLEAGWHKVGDAKWVETGEALKGFWMRIVTVPTAPGAKPPIVYDWYRDFIQRLLDGGHYPWFAKLVAYGEVLVGAALILGVLTGIAAFFGTVMNMSFMLAGTASTNPVLFGLAVFLIMAWKVAGYWGLDHWVLPAVGTPWSRRNEAA